MAFSYDKLWKLLIDKKMTKENFRLLIKASPTTIAAMGKGCSINTLKTNNSPDHNVPSRSKPTNSVFWKGNRGTLKASASSEE